MSQTDRQTDKSTHWKSAIFENDDNWSKLDTLPSFVKTVYRQKEICPTTGNPHFQVHVVCHRQVRLKQMCSWIKATKWIPVKGDTHIKNSINYTAKTDTAVAGTHQVQQGEAYLRMHELLLEIAKQYTPLEEGYTRIATDFGYLTSRMVAVDPVWADKLCNPALEKAWKLWGNTFISHVASYAEATSGAYIIEGPASEEDPPVSEEYELLD